MQSQLTGLHMTSQCQVILLRIRTLMIALHQHPTVHQVSQRQSVFSHMWTLRIGLHRESLLINLRMGSQQQLPLLRTRTLRIGLYRYLSVSRSTHGISVAIGIVTFTKAEDRTAPVFQYLKVCTTISAAIVSLLHVRMLRIVPCQHLSGHCYRCIYERRG